MSEHRLHNVVYAALATIAEAEKITRKSLGALSRDALVYVPETDDIALINRLLNVLTPVNRRSAIEFFKHFLPWEVEADKQGNFIRFGKRTKKQRVLDRKMEQIREFLAEEGNTIWTWSDENLKIEKKKDFVATVKRAVKQALDGDKKTDTPPLTREQLMEAIFEGGVTIDDMIAGVDHHKELMEQEQAMHEAEIAAEQTIPEVPQAEPEAEQAKAA